MPLAILGEKPRFERPVYILRPSFPSKTKFLEIFDQLDQSRVLTNNGPYVQQLEKRLSRYLGVKHVIITSSATTALMLLFKAMGLKGEVILPSFTFIATAHSLLWQNIIPVFADIEDHFPTVCPESVKRLISKRTSAIIGVNVLGHTCDIDGLMAIAHHHKVPLIFDSAPALGSIYKGRKLGGFGEAEVFSLHSTKIVHSMEGGFISTNNSLLAEKLKLLRNFGFNGYDCVDSLGINGKMSEIHAAVGLKNLENIDKRIKQNGKVREIYQKFLAGVPGVHFPKKRTDVQSNNHSCYITIERDFGITRDQLVEIFNKENIIVRRYYFPGCHKQQPYCQSQHIKDDLANTEKICESILCLPCYPELTRDDIVKIASVLTDVQEWKDNLRTLMNNPSDLKPSLAHISS